MTNLLYTVMDHAFPSYLTVDLATLQVVILYDDDSIDGIHVLEMIDEISFTEVNRDFACNSDATPSARCIAKKSFSRD